MKIPDHIRSRIHDAISELRRHDGYHVDNEGIDAGAIPLMGTIGAVWLLRPDGTFWDVDSDFGKPLARLPEELEIQALVAGTKRYPWLAELLPARPASAEDCRLCSGTGQVRPSNVTGRDEDGVLCPNCNALGWVAHGSSPP